MTAAGQFGDEDLETIVWKHGAARADGSGQKPDQTLMFLNF